MTLPGRSFVLVRGLKEHLQYTDVLLQLREATGRNQNPSTDPLWFATSSVAANRMPWTIIEREGDCLVGAVMLREQMAFGFATRYFYASDAAADDFIIASTDRRADVLSSCTEALLGRFRSAVILLSTERDYSHLAWKHFAGAAKSSVRYRLQLKTSWDETLKQFGSRSRRNLRYYPKRLMSEGVTFHTDLVEEEVRSAALELRTKADYPPTLRDLNDTISANSRTPGHFAVGLRKSDGHWLSLLLGWRNRRSTYVFFQMNDTTLPQSSVSTTLRALFIQDELVRGSSEIMFVSSSSSLMESGCVKDHQHVMLLAKQTLRKKFIALFANRTLPTEHRLRKVLCER